MNTNDIIKKHDQSVMNTYARQHMAPMSGGGARAVDADGNQIIDFGSGIGANSLGYAHEAWAEAVAGQAKKLQHTSNYYYNQPAADFAERLTGVTGYDKLFFANSGAEANECAIKIARKFSFDRFENKNDKYERSAIITLNGSFHGRTLCTLSATGQDAMHNWFFPFTPGFKYVAPNDAEALREAITPDVCAIMFEPLMGEGGIIELDQEYIDTIFELADENNLLTIADEVQTGAGRTGKFLCMEHFGHHPDVTAMAKGIGGGLPIGVCMAKGEAAEVLTAGTHGTTYGGNPVVCAGANVVLDTILSPGFLDEVTRKGEKIKSALLSMPKVTGVSGKGLMMGITLDGISAADAVSNSLKKGLLCLMAKDKLRLLPPLTISDDEIDAGLVVLLEVLGQKSVNLETKI